MPEIEDGTVRIRIGFITVPGVENVEMWHCQQAATPFAEHYEVIYRECSDQTHCFETVEKATDSFQACMRHAIACGGVFCYDTEQEWFEDEDKRHRRKTLPNFDRRL